MCQHIAACSAAPTLVQLHCTLAFSQMCHAGPDKNQHFMLGGGALAAPCVVQTVAVRRPHAVNVFPLAGLPCYKKGQPACHIIMSRSFHDTSVQSRFVRALLRKVSRQPPCRLTAPHTVQVPPKLRRGSRRLRASSAQAPRKLRTGSAQAPYKFRASSAQAPRRLRAGSAQVSRRMLHIFCVLCVFSAWTAPPHR
jgi:hypothetical protein